MSRATPLYLMVKPPQAPRIALLRCASLYGLATGYAAEKYHVTLLRLGESQAWSPARLDRLYALLQTIDAEPCPVAFDRLDGNLLRGRKGLTGLRDLQRMLARRLVRLGLALPDYHFSPHLSLAYGQPSDRTVGIAPIGWLVTEFLFVRSIHGVGHQELGRWPLRRRQLELPIWGKPCGF